MASIVATGVRAMFLDGTIVMAIGMSAVFLFLGTMVALMHVMAEIIKFFPEQLPERPQKKHSVDESARAEELAIVIAAAKAYSEGRSL